MLINDECVVVQIQMSKKLKARAEKVRAGNCTLAELIRRALAAYLEMRERAKEKEPYLFEIRGFSGAAHSRKGERGD